MNIGVYGLGRFGAFWARLMAQKHDVVVYSRSSRPPLPEGVVHASPADLVLCDLLFLCVSISAMEPVVKELSGYTCGNCFVVDTCSVKLHPMNVMEQYLPPGVSYAGSHPMFGPDSAADGVAGLPAVISRGRCSPRQYAILKNILTEFGMKVHEMTAAEHDREAAFTQGVTHLVGRLLQGLDLKPSEIGTLGYNKLLEIIQQTCNDPRQLFVDLQRFNPHTADMRQAVKNSLHKILDSIDSPTREQ